MKGDRLSIHDLLYGLMLPSGNDAAHVLSEYFGAFLYYESAGKFKKFKDYKFFNIDEDFWNLANPSSYFISEMNSYTEVLGLYNTFFSNPHGLSISVNKSTAYDMAVLSCEALDSLQFKKIVGTYQLYKKNKIG